MTNFTDNPLERLMRQKPLPGKRKDKADIENHSDALPELPTRYPLDAVSALVEKLQLSVPEFRCVKHPDAP